MSDMSELRPVALTIAGSDSGGGAGIQADLKTFHAFGVFGTSAITAVTAQNTVGVSAVHPVPAQVLRAQIDAVVSDLRPAAAKTGMLVTADQVRTVAEALSHHGPDQLVLDPVMVATTGERLLAGGAETALRDDLVPLAALVTPNLHEASVLTGLEVSTVDGMRAAARALVEMGAGAALLKGGHLEGDPVDLLWDGSGERVWRKRRLATRHTHGTGAHNNRIISGRHKLSFHHTSKKTHGHFHEQRTVNTVGDLFQINALFLKQPPDHGTAGF